MFQKFLDRLIDPEMEPHAYAYFDNIVRLWLRLWTNTWKVKASVESH